MIVCSAAAQQFKSGYLTVGLIAKETLKEPRGFPTHGQKTVLRLSSQRATLATLRGQLQI